MKRQILVLGAVLLLATACSEPSGVQVSGPKKSAVAQDKVTTAAVVANEVGPVQSRLPLMVVHKSASCGCCGLWVDHMRQAGFTVEVRNEDNLNPIKERVGVPYGKGSCHTAEVGGYFIEGHVPAADVKRLLAERPEAKGLVLPGMPMGSPGMEVPNGTVEPYTVELVDQQGATRAFAQH